MAFICNFVRAVGKLQIFSTALITYPVILVLNNNLYSCKSYQCGFLMMAFQQFYYSYKLGWKVKFETFLYFFNMLGILNQGNAKE